MFDRRPVPIEGDKIQMGNIAIKSDPLDPVRCHQTNDVKNSIDGEALSSDDNVVGISMALRRAQETDSTSKVAVGSGGVENNGQDGSSVLHRDYSLSTTDNVNKSCECFRDPEWSWCWGKSNRLVCPPSACPSLTVDLGWFAKLFVQAGTLG